MRIYKLTFFDGDGAQIVTGASHGASDDAAVASAAQTLRQEPRFAAVEVREGERLVRRLQRADVTETDGE